MIKDMPGLVRAQVQLHVATTQLELETVRAELDRSPLSMARSRVLRGLRDQLTAQLEAWEYLAERIEERARLICVDPRCPSGKAHIGACPGPHRKDTP